jgi:hypothetical protein
MHNDEAVRVIINIPDKQNLLPQIFRKQKSMSLVDGHTVLYTTDGVCPRKVLYGAVFLQDRVNRPTLVGFVGSLRKKGQIRCSIYSPYTVQYMYCICLPAGLMINEKICEKSQFGKKCANQ